MSIKTIIRKARKKGDIKYLSPEKGDGGQLSKTWKMRHRNVMGRLSPKKTKKESEYFDKQKVFPEFVLRIRYKPNISTRDRYFCDGRTFEITHVTNWDEQGKHLLLALEELTND